MERLAFMVTDWTDLTNILILAAALQQLNLSEQISKRHDAKLH